MASSSIASPSIRRRVFSAAVRAVFGLIAISSLPSVGQAQGWGFFGGDFLGPPRAAAPPPLASRRPHVPHHRIIVTRRPVPEVKESEPTTPARVLTPDARIVVVLGDSLGQRLANGLDEAVSDRSDVAIVHKARDSTGLVRADFYDWQKAVTELIAARDRARAAEKAGRDDKPASPDQSLARDKFDVAVMMIGTNDKQSLSEGGKTYEPLSDEWTALYTSRAMAIAEAFKKKDIPLVWVGVPITRSDTFADAMAGLNDIYRDVAAKTGATFVDTWEAFSDDKGNFSAVGPDINGQITRLRAADGIHFTKAGDRKLADFVEIAIRRFLDHEPAPAKPDLAGPAPSHPLAVASPGPETAPKVAPKPDAGPVIPLTEVPVASNGTLRDPSSVTRDTGHVSSIEKVLLKGEAQPAPHGRIDDMSWPRP